MFQSFCQLFISGALFVRTEAQEEPLFAFYLSAHQSVLQSKIFKNFEKNG
jgi:hypothetical protein